MEILLEDKGIKSWCKIKQKIKRKRNQKTHTDKTHKQTHSTPNLIVKTPYKLVFVFPSFYKFISLFVRI